MVLTPQVFLSQNDIGKPITNSGIIAGGDINIQAQNIINSSNLVSGGSIVITADGGTFTNSSGALISNNNINITANNILFNSITNTGNYTNNPNDTTNSYTQIIGSSNIIAGGNLSLISNNTTTLLGTNITSDSLNITSTNDILIGSMQSINNINLGEDYYSYNTSSISSNIIVNNNISITSTNGSFTLEAGEDKEDTHSFTSSSGFMSSTTTTSDYYSLTHNSSNLISNNGNITINVNNNINILGSNISSGNDITLTTTEGDVNILSLINQEYSQVHSVSQGLLSGEVSIVGHSSQSIHQSSITSNNNLTINSSNNINILASNVNGVNGNLDANGNVNILSMMLTDTQTNYHKEQSVDWGAVALAVGVGAMTGGAGAMLGAHLISASLLTAGIAGAGIGASTGLLIGGQVHQGELDKYTTTTTTHVSSVLNFTNNLTITSDKDVNLVASTINANAVEINAVNFNQIDGENATTTEHTHQEMKPNYTNLSGVVGALGFASGIKIFENSKLIEN
jgi:filamentous hemagglutinin